MQVKLIYNRLQFNLTVLLRYGVKKTGLLNVTQGSYKLQVRSPAGSHLSKLMATPEFSLLGPIQLCCVTQSGAGP